MSQTFTIVLDTRKIRSLEESADSVSVEVEPEGILTFNFPEPPAHALSDLSHKLKPVTPKRRPDEESA